MSVPLGRPNRIIAAVSKITTGLWRALLAPCYHLVDITEVRTVGDPLRCPKCKEPSE